MTGQLHPPLLSPAQAASLLEHVLFEQVLECIDLEALLKVRRSLVILVGELEGVDDDQVIDAAGDIIDRALIRLPGNLGAFLRAEGWPAGGCDLCDDEDDDEPACGARSRRRAPPHIDL